MDENYLFHQAPKDLAKDLMPFVPINADDVLYEPFKGEGAFFDAFPTENTKLWTEIAYGKDYKDFEEDYDWVISNPPFKLNTDNKKVNSFWYLLDYYTKRAKKGIAFLGNDYCFSTITPIRQKILNERGFYITKIIDFLKARPELSDEFFESLREEIKIIDNSFAQMENQFQQNLENSEKGKWWWQR